MPGPIYVIGHKNSDLDSVASAYAYARLLQLQGEEQAIPARHGELKPEVRFVLERYQVEPPEALEDVFLQVRDVMRRGVISARVNQPLLEAGQLLQEHNRRSMPVVDSENKVQGIIAVEDFAKLFFNDLDPQSVNRVPLQRDNLVRVLRGRVLVEGRRKLGNRVLVGAMQAETMADYIEPGCLVVLGDREGAQLTAIERGAAALVITGDLLVSQRTVAAATKHGVMIISTAHHTFTAVRLINLSISTQDIMYREFDFCHPEDQMSEVQPALARRRSLPAVDSAGNIVAGLYHEAGIAIPREVAGFLLAGLLYDTLILRSPTCTLRDERVAAELAAITGEDIEQFGQAIFTEAAAHLSERSAEDLLTADFKEFTVGDTRFAIGTVETASPATIEKRIPELLSTMRRLAQERGYSSFLFMIVDIIHMRCHLLISGAERAVAEVLGVPLEADGHSLVVEDLVSRKKQLVPLLPRIQAALSETTVPRV